MEHENLKLLEVWNSSGSDMDVGQERCLPAARHSASPATSLAAGLPTKHLIC